MARSTFSGPILSGQNRFGPIRDIGYTDLVQTALLDFSVTSPGANYGGASGVFVASNNIPNSAATIYTPQSGVFSNSGPTKASAPTADATNLVYRGVVFYVPYSCNITDVIFDIGTIPKDNAGTPVAVSAIQPYVSNNFATSTGVYATLVISLVLLLRDTQAHLLAHNLETAMLHYKISKTPTLVKTQHGLVRLL